MDAEHKIPAQNVGLLKADYVAAAVSLRMLNTLDTLKHLKDCVG